METDYKKQVALFRFGVISDIVTRRQLQKGELKALIQAKSEERWVIPFSVRSYLSPSTIRRWIRVYIKGNSRLESLYPKSRADKGISRVIDPETLASLVQLNKEMPALPVHILIEEMEKRNLVSPAVHLCESTVYRFFKDNEGLQRASPKVDRRRFEAELPNDIWQSDVMHGPRVPYEGKLRKSYLIAFIDDHSRFLPFAAFFLSENITSFLTAFETALLSRGLPRKLYVDNGPAFRSKHLEHITASLGIALVHSKPYTPQGRGKIERFFLTVRRQFLSRMSPATLPGFNLSFLEWLETYHQRKHSSTGEAPHQRFIRHVELLRPAPGDLEDHFRKCVRRRVTKDRAVSLEGQLYEAPVALIGEQVELLFHPEKMDRVEARYKGKTYGFLKHIDTHVNCRVRRQSKSVEIEIKDSATNPKGGKLPFSSKKKGGHNE